LKGIISIALVASFRCHCTSYSSFADTTKTSSANERVRLEKSLFFSYLL